jgi:predicted metal-binding protein
MPDRGLNRIQRESLENLFGESGFDRFAWIDPGEIRVAQWVRMKCTFGCSGYGKSGCCPPQTPSVSDCRRFFDEYSSAVVFHFPVQFEDPEDRHPWKKKNTLDLVELERQVFLAGNERAFVMAQGCSLCQECETDRVNCQKPELARPSPEAMAVDVYTTARELGFPIQVKTDHGQAMDRYAILMVG